MSSCCPRLTRISAWLRPRRLRRARRSSSPTAAESPSASRGGERSSCRTTRGIFATRSRSCSTIASCGGGSATRRARSPRSGRGRAWSSSRRTSTAGRSGMRDLAIVAPDPGFGGGSRALTEALWRAAEEGGREPQLHFLRNPRLPGGDEDPVFTRSRPVRSWLPVPDMEAYKLWLAAPRVADRLRRAKTCFVCAPAASYGYGAVLSRRAFGCWAGTTVDDEWAARRDGVDGLRRTAHAAGAPMMHRLERETLRRARVLWAISAASQRSLAELARVPEERIRLVHIPVDAERFTPLPDDEWMRGLDAPRLVFVGRASDPRKNVTLLLDAFVRLRARVPQVRLTLVGAPPAQPVPEGVDVLGEVASVAEPLRTSALFVLPSLQEGFGLIAAEALA